MNILATSIIDPRSAFHNRFHEIVKCLATTDEVFVIWPRSDLTKASDLPRNGGLSGSFASMRGLPLDDAVSAVSLPWTLDHVRFDLVLNYNTLGLGIAAGLAAKRRRLPVIYDLADDLAGAAAHYVEAGAGRITRGLARTVIAANLFLADSVTCTTATLQSIYRVSPSKCVLLPNGVDVGRFSAPGVPRDSGVRNIRLVFVGALREWLDFGPLFGGMQLIKSEGYSVALSIIGSGPEMGRIRKLALERGLGSQVSFLPAIPYEEVPAAISAADICVLPFDGSSVSRSAMPLKLLEYLAAGKPVIAPPLPEVSKIGENSIWYAKSPQEHATAMSDIMEGVESGERSRRGQRAVEAQYSWDSFRTKLRALVACLENEFSAPATRRC